jgi:hypothetical protein
VEFRESVEKPAPDGPGGFIWAFLVDFLDDRFALTPQMMSMTDARRLLIASSVAHVPDSKQLEVQSAIVDLTDFRGRKGQPSDHGVHYVVVMLTLEGLNGNLGYNQGSVDALEEFLDLWDPESFKMGGPNVRIFQ